MALWACAATLVACGINGPGSDELALLGADADDEGRVPPDGARPPEPIVQGTEAAAYPSAAIVNMKQGGWQVSICSGAVIAPRLVLTAGHCAVGDFDNWDVRAPYAGGQSAHASTALVFDYTDTGGFVNPNQHDVALLVLDSDIVLGSYPELASTAVANGTLVRNIGRIDDGAASYSRLFMSQPVALSKGNAWGYPYAYVSTEVIQSGDSGGPVVIDGVLPHRIVAVNSGAGGGTQILARVDQVHAWLSQQIQTYGGAAPPPSAPTACEHDRCTEGAALVASCDPCVQQVCAQDAYCCSTAWDLTCVNEVASICGLSCSAPPPPPPSEDPCGGVTYAGTCEGAVLSWCENEQLSTVDCGQSGKQCAWDGANNFYNCL